MQLPSEVHPLPRINSESTGHQNGRGEGICSHLCSTVDFYLCYSPVPVPQYWCVPCQLFTLCLLCTCNKVIVWIHLIPVQCVFPDSHKTENITGWFVIFNTQCLYIMLWQLDTWTFFSFFFILISGVSIKLCSPSAMHLCEKCKQFTALL